jgi:hypothetical protein
LILVSDSNWDWQMLLELYPFMPGKPTWARRQNIVGRLAQNWLASCAREAGFFEKLASELHKTGEQHQALVDAKILQRVFQSFMQAPPLGAAALTSTTVSANINADKNQPSFHEDDEQLSSRNTLLSEGENWPETGETKCKK